ncbi:G3BP-like protein, partial [Actinidia chinensis var. chinensis]
MMEGLEKLEREGVTGKIVKKTTKLEIKSVDAQESYNGGVHVLVTGYLAGNDNMIRNFSQTFFLAPQDKGYFVLNDIVCYVEDINHHNGNQNSNNYVELLLTPEQDHSPLQEIHVSEQTVDPIEVNEEEVLNPSPSNNGEVSAVEEEVPVAEVVDEVPDDSLMVVESNSKIEEVPKKSYASIVMDMKESAVMLSSPVLAPLRSVAKIQEQQVNLSLASASAAETLVSGSDSMENGNNQERYTAISPVLQGVCFGFVEFEVASAVQKAVELKPIDFQYDSMKIAVI